MMISLLLAGVSAVAQAPVQVAAAPAVPAAVVPALAAPEQTPSKEADKPASKDADKIPPKDSDKAPAKDGAKPASKDGEKAQSKDGDKAGSKDADKLGAKPDNGDGAGPVVTVAAERPSNRIDRQVYEMKNDISTTNSSAADALNNIPSVTVDPDGSVTLRGSSNVQILIDGKPSAMLQGDARGAALNALPAHDIESIEVINNPGAQFGNEGGGGSILNLVMRRNRTPGGLGVWNVNKGPAGRENSALSGQYHEGLWGFQGGVNFRRDGRNSFGHTDRDRTDAFTGIDYFSHIESQSVGLNDSRGANGELSYKVGDKSVLAANFSVNRRTNNAHGLDVYEGVGATPLPTGDYSRTTIRNGSSENNSWGLRWDSKGDLPGETLKIDLRVSSSNNSSNSGYTNMYLPRPDGTTFPDRRNRQGSNSGTDLSDFTGDYERPVDQGIVKAGYKVLKTINSFDTAYYDIDPLTGVEVLNTGRSNRFELEETILAAYGSYQRRLNDKWGVLGGLRVEHTGLDVHQISSGVDATNSYINYIPSFFLSYAASEKATIRFSYAHRIRRPNGNDLNPFIVYRDEFNVSAGNPKLHPSQSDSFELGYETKFGLVDTNVRAYFRKEHDIIADHSYFISDTVLLTTRENGGTSRSGGLEFTFSGKMSPTFSFNASGNLADIQQRILDTNGLPVDRSSAALSLRGRINYQFTPTDHLQFGVNSQGRTLTGQGYREPNTTANTSWRHTLTPQLTVNVNVTDLFDSNKTATRIDRTTLKESSVRRYDGRIFYVGLSYRFGGLANAGQARQPGERGNRGERGPRPGGEGSSNRPSPESGGQ